jgi:hypothetical protein
VDDDRRSSLGKQVEHRGAVPDIDLVLSVARNLGTKPVEGPSYIALRSEEYGALVVVYVGDLKTGAAEMDADFRTDRTTGTSDEHKRHLQTNCACTAPGVSSRFANGTV